MPQPVDPRLDATIETSATSEDASESTNFTFDIGSRAGEYSFLQPPQGPVEIGRLGDYRILSKLGEGGMGFVFRGEEMSLKRFVALKVMRPEVAAKPSAAERFLREGRAAAALKSDHIITIYRADTANGVPYLAMEFLEGQPLDVWLKGLKNQASLPHALRITRDTLRGLAVAHEKGLIHRDIKPANLWIEKDTSRIKILDFGLTRSNESDEQITADGTVVGTPAFMAPEQARGQAVGPRADLFSVGVVMYSVLAGKSPFSRGNVMETLGAIGFETLPSIHTVRGDVPKEYSGFLDRLLAKSPDQRPANAKAALQELVAIEKALAESARTVTTAGALPVVEPLADAAPQVWSELTEVEALPVRTGPTVVGSRAPQTKRVDGPRKPPSKKWLIAGGLFAFLLLAGGITIVITNKDGTKTKIEVPDGAKVEVQQGGQTVATVRAKDGQATQKQKPATANSPTAVAGTLPPLPRFEYTPIPVGKSPFDKLEATSIPKEERFDWQPKELVAVIGQHHRRINGGPLGAGPTLNGVPIDFSPDGKQAVYVPIGYYEGTQFLHLIDMANHRVLATKSFDQPIFSCRFAADGRSLLIFFEGSKRLQIVTYRDGQWNMKPFLAEGENVWGFPLFSPDRKLLLIENGQDHQVWEVLGDGYVLRKKLEPKGICIGFSSDSNGVYLEKQSAPGQPWEIELASLAKGDDSVKPVLKLGPDNGPIWNGSFLATRVSPDGKTLAVAEQGGQSNCVLYDLTQNPPKEKGRFEWNDPGAPHGPIQFTPDSKTLIRTYAAVSRRDISSTPPTVLPIVLPFGEAVICSPSPDSRTLLTVGSGLIRFFDLNAEKPTEIAPLPDAILQANPYRFAFLPDEHGRVIVPLFRDQANPTRVAQVWDLWGSKPVLWPDPNKGALEIVKEPSVPGLISVTNQQGHCLILIGSREGRVRRAHLTPEAYRFLDEPDQPFDPYCSVDLLRQGFVTVPSGGVSSLWDIREPFEKARLLPEIDPTKEAVCNYLPSRKMLFTRTGGNLTIWSETEGKFKAVTTLPREVAEVHTRISPDGRWLATLPNNGGQLFLYDLGGAKPVKVERFGDLHVTGATFSPDAKLIYTCTVIGELRAHEIATGKEVWKSKLPGLACWMQVAKDGRHLFTHNANGTVYVLRLNVPVEKVEATSKDPDRTTAEFVIGKGGIVQILDVGYVTELAKLPAGPFKVIAIELGQQRHVVTDADLDQFRDLTTLGYLSVRGPITDAGVAKLTTSPLAPQLGHLSLIETRLTDDGLKNLPKFTGLVSLALNGSMAIMGSGLVHLKNMNLDRIALNGVPVKAREYQHLSGLPRLQAVEVVHNELTDDGLKQLLAALPQLQKLQMHMNPALTNAGIKHLERHPTLELVNMGGSEPWGDLTSASLENLRTIPNLRHLGIAWFGTGAWTDADLKRLIGFEKLEKLDADLRLVTDDGLKTLAQLKALKELNIKASKVTAAGVAAFRKARPDVTVTSDFDTKR